MADHDIMRGSAAWARLQDGIPSDVTDPHLRQMFHDYATITMVLVNIANEMLDEHKRLHLRIDRRATDTESRHTESITAFASLRDELLDPREGIVQGLRDHTDRKVGRMTGVLMTVLGGVVVASVMLAANLLARGGAS